MRKYELMMIVSPDLTEEARNTLVASVEEELTEGGTKILSAEHWGVRDLAYRIRSSGTGYYILWTLESDGKNIIPVTKSFNIKKDIWRFMFVKLDEENE